MYSTSNVISVNAFAYGDAFQDEADKGFLSRKILEGLCAAKD
jgi:hypothetical protein